MCPFRFLKATPNCQQSKRDSMRMTTDFRAYLFVVHRRRIQVYPHPYLTMHRHVYLLGIDYGRETIDCYVSILWTGNLYVDQRVSRPSYAHHRQDATSDSIKKLRYPSTSNNLKFSNDCPSFLHQSIKHTGFCWEYNLPIMLCLLPRDIRRLDVYES